MTSNGSRADKPTDATDASLLDAMHMYDGTVAVYDDAEKGEWLEANIEDCIDQQVWA